MACCGVFRGRSHRDGKMACVTSLSGKRLHDEMAKQLFGTDGIRGVPGEYPLDDATLARVGAALGEYLRSLAAKPRVLIGRDTRESGPHIAGVIANGLASVEVEPVSAGVLTTPGVAWL